MKRFLIRAVALGLFVLSLNQAWAGVWLYTGSLALRERDFESAFTFLEKAEKWDRGNPRVIYELGRISYALGSKTNRSEWFERAFVYFQALVTQLPYYGKGWLYLGLSRFALAKGSENRVDSKEWNDIKNDFRKGVEQEPGNAWIAYMTGTYYLSQDKTLSPEEREWALNQIKRALQIARPQKKSSNE